MPEPKRLSEILEDASLADAPRVRVGRAVGIFALCLLVFLGGTYLALPHIAGYAIKKVLAEKGYPDARLKVTRLGPTEIDIDDFALSADNSVAARRVVVAFSPGRLVDGTIDGIVLEAPTLPLTLDASGLDVGALKPLLGGPSTPDDGKAGIVGPIEIRGGALQLRTPVGVIDANLDGRVLFTDGLGTTAKFKVDLRHPDAQLQAHLDGVLDDNGQIAIDVVIDNAKSAARFAFADLTGTLHIGGARPSTFDGAGTLTVKDAAFDGLPIGTLDLSAAIADTRAEADLVLGGDGTGLAASIGLVVDDILDPRAKVSISGDAATDGLRGPVDLPGALDMVGAVAFDIEGARHDLQALASLPSGGDLRPQGSVHGWLQADQLSLAHQGAGFDVILNGRLDFASDAKAWRIEAPGVVDIGGAAALGDAARAFSAKVSAQPDAPLLTGGMERSQALIASLRLDGTLDERYPLSGNIDGIFWRDAVRGLLVEDLVFALDPRSLQVGGLDVALENATVHLSGVPGDMSLDIATQAGINGRVTGDTEIVGGRIDLQSRIDIAPDAVRAYPPGCFDVRAVTVRSKDIVIRPQPMNVCPPADGGPMITARMDENGLKRIEALAVFGSTEVVAEGIVPYPLAGTLPRLDAQATFDAARRTWWTKFDANGGALRIEGPDVAVTDVMAQGEMTGQGDRLVGIRFPKLSLKAVDHRRPLRVAPMIFKGQAEIVDNAVQVGGDITGGGAFKSTLALRHRLDNRRGSLKVTLPPWRFVPDNTQPTQAVPMLRGWLTDVSGALSGSASIDWTSARTASSATLTLDNLSFGTQPAEIAGVSGTIKLVDLLTPKTDGKQTIALGLVDAGVPLVNGTLAFTMPGDGTAVVHKLSWPFAGGQIATGEAVVPLDDLPSGMTVEMTGLDATALVNLMEVPDLRADGKLTGSIPLSFGPDGPVIEKARIRSIGGGSIRYRAAEAAAALRQSGSSAELLASALENFQFTDIDMSLDGPLSGEIRARAQINGANPNLYDGKRIELNVNLSGVLRDLLRSATVFEDLPASIRDRVQGSAGNR